MPDFKITRYNQRVTFHAETHAARKWLAVHVGKIVLQHTVDAEFEDDIIQSIQEADLTVS